jgi:HD-like signal output (HDOD) protein/CheY-like chemotaxis protein
MAMRILVVDDEMVSRTKMETLMQTFGDCTIAQDGFQAIAMYTSAYTDGTPYHLVMLDIDMPDLKGTEVLHHIRDVESQGNHRAIVLMVTAQAAKELVLSSIQGGCDDYIAKPFNINIIRNKLKKYGIREGQVDDQAYTAQKPPVSPEGIFKDINKALGSGELALPAMPQTGIKFREMVQNHADVAEMADLLKQDVVIVSKLIRHANSAIFRGYEKVQNLEKAIRRLGLAETEQIVMAISSQKLFMVKDRKYGEILQNLWTHSLACAYGVEALHQTLEKNFSVDPFTAGLFHDIGAFALVFVIAALEKRGRYDQPIALEDVYESVRLYHTAFGAKLLEKWAFENEYIRIALYHNDLSATDELTDDLVAVYFASQLAKTLGYAADGQEASMDQEDGPAAMGMQLDAHHLAAVKRMVGDKMASASEWLN